MRETIFKQINNVQLKWAFLDKVNDKGNYPSYKYEVVVSMDYDQKEADHVGHILAEIGFNQFS